VHAVENPKPTDDIGVLPMVQSSSSAPIKFSINSFSLKWISQRLKQKVTEKGEDKRVQVPGIPEFIATADSEASDAKNPRFEGVACAEVPADAPGGVGTAPKEEVEVEVEEEDHDVHFKRKRQGGSRRKRVVKKPRRYTPTVNLEGESAIVPPPPAPLVIKLSAQKQTTDKAIPGLGKTSFIFCDTYLYISCSSLVYLMIQEPKLQENKGLL